jgi:hypothetical protein
MSRCIPVTNNDIAAASGVGILGLRRHHSNDGRLITMDERHIIKTAIYIISYVCDEWSVSSTSLEEI